MLGVRSLHPSSISQTVVTERTWALATEGLPAVPMLSEQILTRSHTQALFKPYLRIIVLTPRTEHKIEKEGKGRLLAFHQSRKNEYIMQLSTLIGVSLLHIIASPFPLHHITSHHVPLFDTYVLFRIRPVSIEQIRRLQIVGAVTHGPEAEMYGYAVSVHYRVCCCENGEWRLEYECLFFLYGIRYYVLGNGGNLGGREGKGGGERGWLQLTSSGFLGILDGQICFVVWRKGLHGYDVIAHDGEKVYAEPLVFEIPGFEFVLPELFLFEVFEEGIVLLGGYGPFE